MGAFQRAVTFTDLSLAASPTLRAANDVAGFGARATTRDIRDFGALFGHYLGCPLRALRRANTLHAATRIACGRLSDFFNTHSP